MLPGLDSYRGRYAYLSLFVCLALMLIAYLGWNQFNQATESQLLSMAKRTRTNSLLVEAQGRINLLENRLQRIVIEPLPDGSSRFNRPMASCRGSCSS